MALLTAAVISACTDSTHERIESRKLKVYVGNDGRAGPDGGAHPQVVRLQITAANGTSGSCTAWLSSSNTMTTAAHCVRRRQDAVAATGFMINPINANTEQAAALLNLGPPIAVLEHPEHRKLTSRDGRCFAVDIAVLVYDPTKSISRKVLKPLPVIAEQSDEPKCEDSKFDYCVTLLGTGLGGPFTNGEKCVRNTNAVLFLNMESGLRNGSCVVNDDALSGEYDYDDSTPCPADSGAPILWRESGEVMAMHSNFEEGDGADDSTGPILWITRGSPNAARQWFWPIGPDRDGDDRQAAQDNCDLVFNPDQKDRDGDDIGDACDDSDNDGLTDAVELANGTNPDVGDSDGDGLSDGDEIGRKTDPLKSDTDGDGLSDGDEVNSSKTNPLVLDMDGDGLTDGEEVLTRGTNPVIADTDADGLTDGQEVKTYLTNPLSADTDGEGLSDGDEVLRYRTNPLRADTDADLLDDAQEVAFGSDPNNPDTDGDGVLDGQDTSFIAAAVVRLPDASVKPSKNPIMNELEQSNRKAERGDLEGAAKRLEGLRKHLDGCGVSPGNDDWVVTCPEQIRIRGLIDLVITNLGR